MKGQKGQDVLVTHNTMAMTSMVTQPLLQNVARKYGPEQVPAIHSSSSNHNVKPTRFQAPRPTVWYRSRVPQTNLRTSGHLTVIFIGTKNENHDIFKFVHWVITN